MDKAPVGLIEKPRVQRLRPVPRLKLLIELEPRHRVFFRNLADLLLSRRLPEIPLTSKPARFWNDVFVPSNPPWTAFMESMLWHFLLTILFVWGQSKVWPPVKLFQQSDASRRTITYYPDHSFPSSQSRASKPRTNSRVRPAAPHQPARQAALPVTPQQKPSFVTPPDIKQATAKPPNLAGSHTVTPMVPFAATTDQRRTQLAGSPGVVAPQPQVDQSTARRLALPQASAVTPAPDLGGPSADRTVAAPNTAGLRVVPPAPSVQTGGGSSRAGQLSSLSGTAPNVVPPPPSVQEARNAGGTRSGLGKGSSPQVIPPPPSVQGGSDATRTGQLSSLPGTRTNIVPPPPAVQGSGNGAGRLGSMAGTAAQVVPPPPSVQGTGSASARTGSLSGARSDVVAPPPTVETAGNSGAGGRLNSLAGSNGQIVPPPPSAEGAGSSNGRLSALPGNGSGAAAPVVASGGAGGNTGKVLQPMDPLPTDGAGGSGEDNETQGSLEELPLGLIGLVFASPGTSFFSNFEVFVAKRRVGKDQMQLIKLVYEFLPYQRPLSEYDLNNLPVRVIKLRVIPDPTCDESLGDIIQSHADPTHPYPKLPAALRSIDLNAVLPCYRTNAGDFQKAMSRGH